MAWLKEKKTIQFGAPLLGCGVPGGYAELTEGLRPMQGRAKHQRMRREASEVCNASHKVCEALSRLIADQSRCAYTVFEVLFWVQLVSSLRHPQVTFMTLAAAEFGSGQVSFRPGGNWLPCVLANCLP